MNASRWITAGAVALLALATLGEGGGSPAGLLGWHGLLMLLLIVALSRPAWDPSDSDPGSQSIPGGVAVGWTLFLVLCVLGAARVPYAYGAILVLLELAAWTATVYLGCVAGPGLLRRIVTPLALVGALQGLLAVYQSVATDSRPAGTFLVPNHMALWLSAVLLLLVGRAVDGGRSERLQAWFLGPPVLAGIVTAGSRGAVLGLVVGGGWLLLTALRRLSRRMRWAVGAGAALLLLLLGTGLLLRMRGHDPFRYQRVRIWSASLNGFLEDPLWGTGPGQFEAAAANQRFPDGDGPLRYDRAHKATHSDWLRLPAEFGTPATLVLLGTSILALGRIVRRRRAGRLPPGSDGALAAMIALSTHALVDNPTRWAAVYLLAAILTGVLLAERSKPANESRILPAGTTGEGFFRAGLATALLLLFLVADVAPYLAWRAVRGLPRGRLDSIQTLRLERALKLNRIHPDYRMRLAEHLAAGPPLATAYAEAREAGEQALRLQPVDARYRRALARIEARACIELFRTEACRERVQLAYAQAGRLSRYDPTIPLEAAIFLLELGDPLGARRSAERALVLEPEAVLPRLALAEALIDSEGALAVGEANELMREAQEKAAQWSEAAGNAQIRDLLVLDREQFERLRLKIAAFEPFPAPAGAPPVDGPGKSS